jgi:hypothetical protein
MPCAAVPTTFFVRQAPDILSAKTIFTAIESDHVRKERMHDQAVFFLPSNALRSSAMYLFIDSFCFIHVNCAITWDRDLLSSGNVNYQM